MLRREQITRLKERTWQWEAKESVEKALDENQRLFAINACVGSGKTNVAFEAMISFIEKFNPEKSVHLFVCPRLSLCDQQLSDMKEYITSAGIEGSFVLLNSSTRNKELEHLTVKAGIVNPLSPENRHVFIVACDASVWGDKKGKEEKIRFNRFKKFLETVVFEDAAVETLYLDHIVSEKQNKYKEPSDFLLDEKHKVFRNAVIEYNKAHSNGLEYKGWMCTLQGKEKGLFDSLEDSLLFEIPIYTPSPLNGVARQGESYEHNVLRKPIEYRKRASAPFILYIKDEVQYNNFSNWWYSAKKRREGGLINFMFDILFILYGGDPSLLKYVEVIPHLDWSHPWTDSEILKELGLPEDFLGE